MNNINTPARLINMIPNNISVLFPIGKKSIYYNKENIVYSCLYDSDQ